MHQGQLEKIKQLDSFLAQDVNFPSALSHLWNSKDNNYLSECHCSYKHANGDLALEIKSLRTENEELNAAIMPN